MIWDFTLICSRLCVETKQRYYLSLYAHRPAYHTSLKMHPLHLNDELDLDTKKVEEETLQIHL